MNEGGHGQIDTPEKLPSKRPVSLGLKSIVHIVIVLVETSYTE